MTLFVFYTVDISGPGVAFFANRVLITSFLFVFLCKTAELLCLVDTERNQKQNNYLFILLRMIREQHLRVKTV